MYVITRDEYVRNLQLALNEERVAAQLLQDHHVGVDGCLYHYPYLTEKLVSPEDQAQGKHIGCAVGAALPIALAQELDNALGFEENGGTSANMVYIIQWEETPVSFDSDETMELVCDIQSAHDTFLDEPTLEHRTHFADVLLKAGIELGENTMPYTEEV